MCGRFAITLPPEDMRRLFRYEEQPNFPARYNIAPTQPIPIIRTERHEGRTRRRFALARWAFLPGFVKDPKAFPLLFNARSEGLADKASFRNAVRRRRCIVPADAFYEWHRIGDGRGAASTPYLCRRADGQALAFAALWETWSGPNGEEVDTVCLITTAANRRSSAIHPRLPAIVEMRDLDLWLDPDEANAEAALALLVPTAENTLTFLPVGPAVNTVANDGPEIQVPVGRALDPASAPSIGAPAQEDQPRLF